MVCEDMRYLFGISAWVYNHYQKSQQAGPIIQIDRKARAGRENTCYKSRNPSGKSSMDRGFRVTLSPKPNMENDTQIFRVVSRTNQAGTSQAKLERK